MMEVKDIIELMKAISEYGLTGFELEEGDWKLTMKREKKGTPGMLTEPEKPEEKKKEAIGPSSDQIISCPLVGTFYSSPSPEAEDFVKVGDRVKKGQVIGIVEAMKLMNEIESEYDGVVEAILVKNEETVEYGQPLFRIR